MTEPPPDNPQFKVGDKLVLAAPAHSGLPNGATAIISARTQDAATGWCYAVTLTGGGASGSDVKFVKSVPEGWLRFEGRIATAKTCAPMAIGTFLRLAPKMVVPLFQRRYCWSEMQWRQLWSDVVSPRFSVSATNPHAMGRVVIAREPNALVLVDGQQRCTTLMLLLCAIRDVARELDVSGSSTVVSSINALLLSRSTARRLQHRGGSLTTEQQKVAPHELVSRAIEQAKVGLEMLPSAQTVRLVPSRDDRLPFCAIVLAQPFDREASGGARTMAGCHDYYLAETRAYLRKVTDFRGDSEGLVTNLGEPVADCGAAGSGALPDLTGAAGLPRPSEPAAQLEALRALTENVLKKLSVVVFELQDGVALQNMYDMLAQRERALNAFFANVGGKAMSQADLVRNLLLSHIADEDERMKVYDECWCRIERAHGDGDADTLERFLRTFLHDELPDNAKERLRPKNQGQGAAALDLDLLKGYGELMRLRGGSAGAIDLQAAGTESADGSTMVVEAEAAERVARALLEQMHGAGGGP